jgi:hypothetical protein
MHVSQSTEKVSRLTSRMMAMLLRVAGHSDALPAPGGLPAGAVHIPSARLILAGSCCTVRLFDQQIMKAAQATGSDVVMMRHGLFPEVLDAVAYDVAVHVDGEPVLLTDFVLYDHPADGFWLVPVGEGPCIALEPNGLRLADESPFLTWSERCDAVCRAAKQTVEAARLGGGY